MTNSSKEFAILLVALLSYLGNYGGLRTNPERVVTFTVRKMSFEHCCASTT